MKIRNEKSIKKINYIEELPILNGGERGIIGFTNLIVFVEFFESADETDHTMDHTLQNHPFKTSIELP